ncbi:TrbI/VirB10 family protein [Ochrobactrum sp. BTU1]|uniref:TrbI/VirB10 family protein n=1 Tax=Ochrobactrum sp. BTU1 TaxID=2840456 RepID=UPI001C059E4D|nr:hypothetical protein KMS41_25800 [Ochrobactrum sp. BTU1]
MTENAPEPVTPTVEAPKSGLEQSVIKRHKRARFNSTFYLLGGAVLVCGVGLTVFKAMHTKDLGNSRISRPPSVDTTPAGKQLAESQRYKETLDTVNRRNAEKAEQDGESFVATPDEPLRDIDDKPKPLTNFRKPVAPANEPEQDARSPVVTTQAAASPQPAVDYSRINQLASRIATKATEYERGWGVAGSTNTIVLNQDLYKTPAQRKQAVLDRTQKAQEQIGGEDFSPNNAINAGQFAFARLINSTDSDTPGPVVVEIMKKGPLYKARMIGEFKQNDTTNALIVQFNRMVFPDGSETQVSAYAVDAAKGSIAVQSEVDRRYFARYAPLIAASFIEGLGSTLAKSGRSIIYGPGYAMMNQQKPRFEQGLYAGAGKVGQRMAQDIERLAPKGPLVKLNAGNTVGILFLQGVPMPHAVQLQSQEAAE